MCQIYFKPKTRCNNFIWNRFIKNSIIQRCRQGIINLHGGDPQFYRGLDSHLWAIYHKDFSNLKVCLHRINNILDDGEIIDMRSIKMKKLELYMLRSENTKLCVELTLSALKNLIRKAFSNFFPKLKEDIIPYAKCFKEICLTNFNRL